MDSFDWGKVKEIFALAVEEPTANRFAFVREKCGGDADLQAEIESLLAASDEPEHLIERDEYGFACLLDSTGANYAGKTFGHYKIIREIGRGGMGAVFLAERADGEFNQQVALKIVHRSFVEPELKRRFRQERQILATLNHPNIAGLLDGGVSSDGEPFLVMEYVAGARIDEFCERGNLSAKERLKLFLEVCRAVSFAHQNLIVHRDIKPSNIIVTGDAVPKLLDFGIAKLLDAEHANETTKTNFRAFTPEFAAPEQIAGGQTTTATDTFSLGVLLSKIIANPQTEIQSIIQMARREEPIRRYVSVQAFADDVQRFLDGLPIKARQDSFSYRAAKFIRRNKTGVAASFLIVLSLIVGLAISLWQANVARLERDRAAKRFADVRQLSNALLNDIAPKIERLPGSTAARVSLVNQSLKYLDSLANESADDLDLQAELATAYEKVADLQGNPAKPNLSDFAGAIASYEKARLIRQRLPTATENQKLLAANFRQTANVLYLQNDIKNSLDKAETGVKIYEKLLAEDSSSFELTVAALEARLDYADLFAGGNQFAEAAPRLRQTLVEIEKLDRSQLETNRLLAKGYSLLGNALSWNDQQPEAEIEMAKAVRIAAELTEKAPNDADIGQAVWRVYILSSGIYESINDETSLRFAEKALAAAQIAAADTANAQAKQNLGKSYSRIGAVSVLLNKLPAAIENLAKAEKIFLELTEREPQNLSYRKDLGNLYTRRGDALERGGDLPAALRSFQKSADIFAQTVRANEKNTLAQRDLAQSLKSVGKIYLRLGENSRARQTFEQAAEILIRLKVQNALGDYDRQLFDEVQTALQN